MQLTLDNIAEFSAKSIKKMIEAREKLAKLTANISLDDSAARIPSDTKTHSPTLFAKSQPSSSGTSDTNSSAPNPAKRV